MSPSCPSRKTHHLSAILGLVHLVDDSRVFAVFSTSLLEVFASPHEALLVITLFLAAGTVATR